MSNCGVQVALRALSKGHVRWERLHPAVRQELERNGYAPLDNAALTEPVTLAEWFR